MRTRLVPLVLALPIAGALVAAPPALAHGRTSHAAVTVRGAVAAPASYDRAALAALPKTTLPDERKHGRRAHSITGVPVLDLVQAAMPVLPATKNAALSVVLTVSGAGHRREAIALGELDPGFGDHPALLVAGRGGPTLEFPGDRDHRRDIAAVSTIDVAVVAPDIPKQQSAGSVVVIDGRHRTVLTAHTLARLPERTLQVSFLSGTAAQTHVETGPSLDAVLRLAHVRPGRTTAVAAVGSDAYVAAVTPAEARTGGRPLLLSTAEDGVALPQPRLVTDGDVKGGRYVSDVVALVVTR